MREVFVCFAPPSLLFFDLFVMTSKCCKRITLETVAPIAQIFAGVFVTFISSYSCRSCWLFAGERFFFFGLKCREAIVVCVHRWFPQGTTLHIDGPIAQIFGSRGVVCRKRGQT